MPKILLTVPETVESVVRPVVLEIVRDICKVTGLDPKTNIQYPGTMDVMKQAGTSLESQGDATVRTSFTNKLTIDVEEGYEEDRLLSTAVMRPENLFIFMDERLETYIKPAYSSTDMTINFRFRAVDKTSATRWRDDIRARISRNLTERIHSVSYHYLIPPAFLEILKEIHRLREAVAPYGEDYDTYFRANSTQRASILTNLSGVAERWGISETQMRIVGWFDFVDTGPEKGGKDDDGDTWTVGFAYKFKFDQPIACVMSYPLMVHNQLLGLGYRPGKDDQVDRPEIHARSYTHSAKAFSMFEKGRQFGGSITAPQPGVQIPDFDEFIPASVPSKTLRLFTALTSIDTTPAGDPKFLLDLRALSRQWKLDTDVLEYMATIPEKLTLPKACVLKLDLYENRQLVQTGALTVDQDLKVYSTVDLDLRNYYHVRLGLAIDWASCGDHDNLREHGPALCKLAKAISPAIQGCCCSSPSGLLGGRYVSRACLKCIIDEIDALILGRGDGQVYQFNTVQTLFLEAQPPANR
jgi:hypothetical protein